MPNYRRAFVPGGTWFFTVNLLERYNNDLLIREVDLLREKVRAVKHAILSKLMPGWFCLNTFMPFGRCLRETHPYQQTMAFD
jgi:hypothetical protein